MVDGVQEKEFSTKLTETLGPMLPFPCVFQVAQDNICAFEFTRLQHYDAIVQISSSEQAFPMTAFIRVLEQVDNYSPPFIVFHEHDSSTDALGISNTVLLPLAKDGELPVLEFCQAIVSCAARGPAQYEQFVSITSREVPPSCELFGKRSPAQGSLTASPATDCEGLSSCGGESPAFASQRIEGKHCVEDGMKAGRRVQGVRTWAGPGLWKPVPARAAPQVPVGQGVTEQGLTERGEEEGKVAMALLL